MGPRRRGLGQARVLVEPRLDAEGQQQHLGLAQQLERRRVQRDVARLLAVVGHGGVRGEEAAEHRGQGRPVQLEDRGGEADGRGALVQDRELAEPRHRGGLAQHEPRGGRGPGDHPAVRLAAEPAHRLERGAPGVHRVGDRGQERRLARVGGEHEGFLRVTADHRLRQVALRHRHPDAQGQVSGEAAPAEARAAEGEAVAHREVGHRDVAAAHREDLVIAGDPHLVAEARPEIEDRLVAGGEDAGHQVGLAVRADDARGLADQRIDPLPAVRGGHQGLAGHARVARVDPPVLGAGVPLVDRGVVLHAGVGAGPGRVRDLVPELLGGHRARALAVGAALELPLAAAREHVEEGVGHAHAVVGVLAGDRVVGLAVPVGVVLREVDLAHALAGQEQHALDVAFGYEGRARLAHRGAQRRILARVDFDAGGGAHRGQHRLEAPLGHARAADQRRHLLLLHHLPPDEGEDVRVVEIEDHHLGGPPGRPARLDGARRAVADPEERHQAGGLAAARERLVRPAQQYVAMFLRAPPDVLLRVSFEALGPHGEDGWSRAPSRRAGPLHRD